MEERREREDLEEIIKEVSICNNDERMLELLERIYSATEIVEGGNRFANLRNVLI